MEQIVDLVPMKDYHVMTYERIEPLYLTFEISPVFLCVLRDAPSTSILVVARVANAVSKQTAKSLTSQSMRERFIEAALLGRGQGCSSPRKSSTYAFHSGTTACSIQIQTLWLPEVEITG